MKNWQRYSIPLEAIKLHRYEENDTQTPPVNEADWFKKRGQERGIDFSQYE
jgi:hypothetical protein